MNNELVIKNEDVKEVLMEVPEGHKHIRTYIRLTNGTTIVFQEATIANIVRAFVSIKTHPQKERVVLRSLELKQRKEGYAKWQLLEVEE